MRRCKHTESHVTQLRGHEWLYVCLECHKQWTEPVVDEDVPLITALNGGTPDLRVVK